MKTYNHLWEQMLTRENVELAFKSFRKGRTNDPIVIAYDANPDLVADRYIALAKTFPKYSHKPHRIYDGVERKVRTIIVPKRDEQIIHHMAMAVLKPIFMKPMYEHSYGSIPGRGCLKGKERIEKWIRRDKYWTKHYLQMDIRKYFENVDHDILMEKLGKIIKDDNFLRLLRGFVEIPLEHGEYLEKGMPLGFYPSQWFANFFLTEFDHYVKEVLKAEYYVRYMDDLVIFGSNKRKLIKMEKEIEKYLYNNLRLVIKPTWTAKFLSLKDGQDLDFMGYRFYRNRTTLRRKIMYRVSAKARKVAKKPKPTLREAKQLLSQVGKLRHCDVYDMYLNWIKPYVDIRKLKRIVSAGDRRRNKCGINQSQLAKNPAMSMLYLPRLQYSSGRIL